MLVPRILVRVAASTQLSDQDIYDLYTYIRGKAQTTWALRHRNEHDKDEAVQEAILRVIKDKPQTPDEVERVIRRALEQCFAKDNRRAKKWPTASYNIHTDHGDTDCPPVGKVLSADGFVDGSPLPFEQETFDLHDRCQTDTERELIVLIVNDGASIQDAMEQLGLDRAEVRIIGRRLLDKDMIDWQARQRRK